MTSQIRMNKRLGNGVVWILKKLFKEKKHV